MTQPFICLSCLVVSLCLEIPSIRNYMLDIEACLSVMQIFQILFEIV